MAVTQRKIYKYPPIEEALCEIRFVDDTEWDPMFLLQFQSQIKDTYPGKPTLKLPLDVDLRTESDQRDATFHSKGEPFRTQFPDRQGRSLVTVGQNSLSVHMLQPYKGWEEFRLRIEDALHKYSITTRYSYIRRIGLRYVNKIVIKGTEPLYLSDYFTFPPTIPVTSSVGIARFFSRTEYIYLDHPIKLIQTFSDTERVNGDAIFLLDLDVIWKFNDLQLPVNEAMEKIDELKERERDAFEGSITKHSREMFDAIPK